MEYLVTWGLEHRVLGAIRAIGVDEIQRGKGHKYLTLVYQIDLGCARLLWMGKERTVKTFKEFFAMMGPEVWAKIEFVCSDVWKRIWELAVNGAGPAPHVSCNVRRTQPRQVNWPGAETLDQKLANERRVTHLCCRYECAFLTQVETKFTLQSLRRCRCCHYGCRSPPCCLNSSSNRRKADRSFLVGRRRCARARRYGWNNSAVISRAWIRRLANQLPKSGRVGGDRKGAPPLVEPEMQISHVRLS